MFNNSSKVGHNDNDKRNSTIVDMSSGQFSEKSISDDMTDKCEAEVVTENDDMEVRSHDEHQPDINLRHGQDFKSLEGVTAIENDSLSVIEAVQSNEEIEGTSEKEDYDIQALNEMQMEDTIMLKEDEDENDQLFYRKEFLRRYLNTSDSEETDEEESENDAQEGDVQENPTVRYKVSQCATFAGLKILECFEGVKVKAGQRVVRGRDWEYGDNDGGEGNIGTVTHVNQETVNVQWDSQETSFEYRIGKDKKFDLRLYDNAQTGVKHVRFGCDECYESPIIGMKWRCRQCEDYDLCTDCYMENEHDVSHVFERKQENESISVELGPRKYMEPVSAKGILNCADVKLRSVPENGQTGFVSSFLGKKLKLWKCDAVVKMENEKHSRRYRIGREGNTDLKYTDSENNPSCTYYRDHLPTLTNETVKVGMRVITDAPISDNGMLGTIVNIKTQKPGARKNTENMAYSEIDVQFDNGFTKSFEEPRDLKLYDNGQTGTVHGAYCDTCNDQTLITGLRWKCTQCSDFDLCTACYMNDEDDINHIYQRIVQEGASETLKTTRKEVIESRKTLSGIFVETEVTALDDVHSKGKVKRFCNYNIDVQRNAVNVIWSENESREEIIDLICTSNEDSDISYYPEHLPDLGNDSRGYVKVKDGNAEATVILWFNKDVSSRRISEKPKLYITFADNSNIYKSDNTIRGHIREIKKFSRKNKLPCHSVSQKLLFVEDRVFIHHKTDPAVIKLLISLGISIIHRGDANDDEDEMLYFKRMAEYSCEDLLLPVIISMGNGKSSREVLQYASENKIPIVYFKKDTEKGHDAFVLTPDEEFLDSCKATEHRFDLKTPWKRQKVERRVIGTNGDGKEEENEISSLNEITLQQNFSFDAHICYLLIGVSMESDTYGKIFGCLSNVYPNALSMYLLKEGKWKIPKDVIKKSFSHKSLEYIAEESMTEKFEGGLWKELQEMSGHAYKPPAWVKIKKNDCVSDDSDEDSEDSTDASATKDTQEHKLDVTISDLYGLIFYALLIRKFYNGARQLLETGCVRIRHILVGCVILQKEENKWQTSQLEKEQLQQMHKIFSHHALRIISCIHDADNRSTTKKSRDDGRFRELLLGDPVLHSGRLLLNHGYLKDAIKTENKTFLDNEVVKDILNEKWYGKTKLTLRRKMEFLCFSLLHFALLPVLMFTMESFPFQRIYKIYNIPFMKVLNNLVGLFSLLLGYAYMLLFNHEENISYADIFLMVWIGSFLIDETKQVIIAVWRGKFRMYVQDPWNTLDWLSIITFTCGMLLKTGSGLNYFNASKIFLVLAFILLSIRVLHLFCISELLGPKLVIIQKMFIDTFAFMAVMTVITMCYNVSYYAILYHGNSDFSFDTLEKVTRNGYWMLFGELNLEGDRVTEPDCSFDEAMYSNGTLERCPSSLGRFLAPYLKALYVLVAVILMLNLLIAMYSYTFSEVHVKSKFYWSQLQTDFLEEYSLKSLFPFHMQWLAMPFCFIHFLIWKTRTGCITFCKRDKNRDDSTISDSTSYGGYKEEADVKLNNSPMFVRVFLYDTNFDLKLKKTRELEGHAAMKAKREMDIAEKDKIMVLKEKIKKMKTDFKTSNDKIIEELKKISQTLDQQGKNIERRHSKVGSSRRSSITSTSSDDSL